MKNWKTTTLGITTIIAAVAGAAIHLLQKQPVDWTIVGAACTAGWAMIHAADATSTPQ